MSYLQRWDRSSGAELGRGIQKREESKVWYLNGVTYHAKWLTTVIKFKRLPISKADSVPTTTNTICACYITLMIRGTVLSFSRAPHGVAQYRAASRYRSSRAIRGSCRPNETAASYLFEALRIFLIACYFTRHYLDYILLQGFRSKLGKRDWPLRWRLHAHPAFRSRIYVRESKRCYTRMTELDFLRTVSNVKNCPGRNPLRQSQITVNSWVKRDRTLPSSLSIDRPVCTAQIHAFSSSRNSRNSKTVILWTSVFYERWRCRHAL